MSSRRIKLFGFAFFAFSGVAFCQLVAMDPEQWVRKMLFEPPFFLTGFEMKRWPNLGDAAAPLVRKVLDGTNPDDVTIDRALGIVSIAFARPATLPNVPDREPKATLVLLDSLSASTTDVSLQAKIAKTREEILDHFAKSSVKDSPECLVGNFSTARAAEPPWHRGTFRLEEAFSLLTEDFDGKFNVPSLHYVGDAIARELDTIMGSCTLTSDQVQRVLEMLRGAFERPDLIKDLSDREPKAALVLLDRMDATIRDPKLSSTIADTRQFVLAR
jgi:hypothetical protein